MGSKEGWVLDLREPEMLQNVVGKKALAVSQLFSFATQTGSTTGNSPHIRSQLNGVNFFPTL